MSKKHKKVCRVLNYIDHSLNCNFYNYWMCFHFCFCFLLVGIPIGITSSAIGLKICVITAGITKNKSINKKRKRNMTK